MRRIVDLALGAFLAVVLAALSAAVIWQVATRYLLGVPSTITQEVARVLFLWMAMIGGAFVFGQGRHLAFDFVPQMFRGARRAVVECLILGCLLAFAALVLVWGGGLLTLRTFASGQVLPTFALSQGWIYLSVPLSGAVTIYYGIDDMIRILREGPETVRLGSGTDSMT